MVATLRLDEVLQVHTFRHLEVSTSPRRGWTLSVGDEMQERPDPMRRLYGMVLQHFWKIKAVSAAGLAARANCSVSFLYLVKDGKRLPNSTISESLDDALGTDGLLARLGEAIEGESRLKRRGRVIEAGDAEARMQRRALLQQALAAFAASTEGTAVALETIRDGLAYAVTGEASSDLGVDEWAEIAWEYGRSYLTTTPENLVADLAADVVDVQQLLCVTDEGGQRELSRVGAQMAAVMAMSLINLGQLRAARRWWRTARRAADISGDSFTRVWVRGEEAIRALYTYRSPQVAIDLADEALAIGARRYDGMALAGKAQALAAMGRATEAKEVVRSIEASVEQMPGIVIDDEQTVYGWPERCLRHVESYVYSHIGETTAAGRAQQQALALYPPSERRSRALVQLHQAMCLVSEGHINDGTRHAESIISSLPSAQRTALIMEIGHQVLRAVPNNARGRPSAYGLYEILALPPGQSPT
jgi:tetratricopeptide (TPR) repeat protein